MSPHKEYQHLVGNMLNDVTKRRYNDEHLAMAYQLGLCQSIIARLMLEDNKNYYIFRKIIEDARERSELLNLRK